MASGSSPWWTPSVHEDRRPFLLARGRIQSAVRRYFEDQGFLEVTPAALQVSPGNEAHLHAFATELKAPGGACRPLYLHTSPELAMKKLLAAGERRIFALSPVYRNRERGDLHHPEFTMLEWYRAGEPYRRLIDDCAALLRLAAAATGRTTWSWRGMSADATVAPQRLTVAQAFARHAGVDLLAAPGEAPGDRDRLAAMAVASGIRVAADDTWSDIFSRIMVERVEPHLGAGAPLVLDEYPTVEASLARRTVHDPRVAERFELYVAGVELANAFGELRDPAEQRRRLEAEMAEKERVYGERYPLDEDFLSALALMPEASGIALGFDRLVMLATGATRIEQVIWTPVAKAPDRN